jgi:hypothetical protein
MGYSMVNVDEIEPSGPGSISRRTRKAVGMTSGTRARKR